VSRAIHWPRVAGAAFVIAAFATAAAAVVILASLI
jgi:hypothetical protein